MDSSLQIEANQSPSLLRWWPLAALVLAGCAISLLCLAGGGLATWQRSAPEPAEPAQAALTLSTPSPTTAATTAPSPTISLPKATPANTTSLTDQLTLSAPDYCHASPETPAPFRQPAFSAISFSSEEGERSPQFSSDTGQVRANFRYAGMEDGLAWERVWRFGEQELYRGLGVWDAGSQGSLTLHVNPSAGGFVAGRYYLDLYVAGQLLAKGTFLIASPDSEARSPVQLAYSLTDGQQPVISLVDPAQPGSPSQLPAARSPGWVGDDLLFYQSDPPGLRRLDRTSQETTSLVDEPFSQAVAWSPDGWQAATWVERTTGPRLVLWDLSSGQALEGPLGMEPAWSPDGQQLVYRSCDNIGWRLTTVPILGGRFDISNLHHLTRGDDHWPSWSGDGQEIVFARRVEDNLDIYRVATGGGAVTRLTDQPGPDSSPIWDEAGRIIFLSQREGRWGLYLMNANGSKPRLLVETAAGSTQPPERPAISSGQRLVEPSPTPPPKPRVQIPAGHGILVVSNRQNNDEMTFTIDNVEHKVAPLQYRTIPLPPGHYTWTASWPGKVSRTGVADIALGQAAYPVVER